MATTAEQVMATYFEAWRTDDFDTLRSLLADDVDFVGPLGSADDADTYAEGIERLSEIKTDVVVQKTFVDGSDILTWFDLHTKVAPPTPVANWTHLEDGKIKRVRVTFDARRLAT